MGGSRERDERGAVEDHRDGTVGDLQRRTRDRTAVGARDRESGPGVELDDGVGAGPEVDDLADATGGGHLVGVDHPAGSVDPELLGAYGELPVGTEDLTCSLA